MVSEAFYTPYEFVLAQLVRFLFAYMGLCVLISIQAKGDATPSLTSQSLHVDVTAEDDEILKWTSFTMYLGMISKYSSQNCSTHDGSGSVIYQVELTW